MIAGDRWNIFTLEISEEEMVLTGSQNATGTVTIPRNYLGGFDRISIRTVQIPDAGKRCTADDLLIQIAGTEPAEPRFQRGDSDADGNINITDALLVLNFLFLGGRDPKCEDSADPNDDGLHNITDGIYVLNDLFLGGPAPGSPYPDCGTDPPGDPPDPLGCAEYAQCPPS